MFFSYLITILVLFILSICFIFLIKKTKYDYYLLLSIFSISVITRFIIFITLLISIGDFQSIFFLNDDIRYDAISSEIASKLLMEEEAFYYGYTKGFPNPGYFNLGGFLYYYLGFDTISMRILNIFISSLCVILIFKIVAEITNLKIAVIAAILASIQPTIVIFSGLQIKDIIFMFFLLGALNNLIEIADNNKSPKNYIIAIIFIAFAWTFRRDLIAPLILFLTYIIFFKSSRLSPPLIYLRQYGQLLFILIIIIFLLIILLFNTQIGSNFLWSIGIMFSTQTDLLLQSSVGSSNFLRLTSFTDIYKIPFAMIFVLISPLPGSVDVIQRVDLIVNYISFGNIFNIILLPFVALGLYKIPIHLKTLAQDILLRWFPLIMWVALSIVNLGNSRYTFTIWFFAIIWASFGVYYIKSYKKFFFLYALAIILFFPIIYFKLYI